MRRVLPFLVLAACARDGRLGAPGADGGSCTVRQAGPDAILSCAQGGEIRITRGKDEGAGGHGEDGDRGQQGPAPSAPSFTLRLATPDGCPGGVVVEAEDGEVTYSVNLCPPPPTCERLEASLVFQNSWELSGFLEAGCTEVLDDLQVVIPGLPDVGALRNLRRTGGAVVIAGTAVTGLDGLANLREVGALALVDDAQLESLEALVGLQRAGEIDLENLPALAGLRGLEGLTSTGDLILAGTGVEDLAPLAALSVSPLAISIRSNPRLERVALPATTGSLEALEIRENPALTSLAGLRPSAVTQVLVVSGNNRLPTCEAERLLESLVVKPQRVEISGNDDAGVCP